MAHPGSGGGHERIGTPVAGVGLDALEAFLRSDRAPPHSMLISELDGFLTAIAIGPEAILQSEWLPVVFGGEEPVFASDSEAQAVLGDLMSRYDEILREVEDETFQPVLWVMPDGTEIAEDWAEGFRRALALRGRRLIRRASRDRQGNRVKRP